MNIPGVTMLVSFVGHCCSVRLNTVRDDGPIRDNITGILAAANVGAFAIGTDPVS